MGFRSFPFISVHFCPLLTVSINPTWTFAPNVLVKNKISTRVLARCAFSPKAAPLVYRVAKIGSPLTPTLHLLGPLASPPGHQNCCKVTQEVKPCPISATKTLFWTLDLSYIQGYASPLLLAVLPLDAKMRANIDLDPAAMARERTMCSTACMVVVVVVVVACASHRLPL